MSKSDDKRLSKFLSFVLRHKPDSIGLKLDSQGWAEIEELMALSAAAGSRFGQEDLTRVVETNDKKRFSISADGLRIRAAQGHSIAVDLDLAPQEPPAVLFHGTAQRFLAAILRAGLKPRTRQHVHLSRNEATALHVGQRHGKPVVLRVEARRMHDQGARFFVSENGVWLTDSVPPEFLTQEPDGRMECD